jgi:hypothetical protein
VDSGSVFSYQFAFFAFLAMVLMVVHLITLVSMTLSVITFTSVSFFLLSSPGYLPFFLLSVLQLAFG